MFEKILDSTFRQEKALILLLGGTPQSVEAQASLERMLPEFESSWDSLGRLKTFHPWILYWLRTTNPGLLNRLEPSLREKMEQTVAQSKQDNLLRLACIQTLSKTFRDHGLRLQLLKGAAELCYFSDDPTYVETRPMDDIDWLCQTEDLHTVDALLSESGHEFFTFGWPETEPGLKASILNRYSHYVYDFGLPTRLEVHPKIAAGLNRDSYPPDFSRILWEGRVAVLLGEQEITVPRLELMLVYAICHAASIKDFNDNIFLLPESVREKWTGDPLSLQKHSYTYTMMSGLFKLLPMLHQMDRTPATLADWDEVSFLLTKVPYRLLLDNFLDFTAQVIGNTFPFLPASPDPEGFTLRRSEYFNTVTPQLD